MRAFVKWCRQRDLNSRPTDYKSVLKHIKSIHWNQELYTAYFKLLSFLNFPQKPQTLFEILINYKLMQFFLLPIVAIDLN